MYALGPFSLKRSDISLYGIISAKRDLTHANTFIHVTFSSPRNRNVALA